MVPLNMISKSPFYGENELLRNKTIFLNQGI
jgi:hypothetical protein